MPSRQTSDFGIDPAFRIQLQQARIVRRTLLIRLCVGIKPVRHVGRIFLQIPPSVNGNRKFPTRREPNSMLRNRTLIHASGKSRIRPSPTGVQTSSTSPMNRRKFRQVKNGGDPQLLFHRGQRSCPGINHPLSLRKTGMAMAFSTCRTISSLFRPGTQVVACGKHSPYLRQAGAGPYFRLS